jgi:hypothetical protein
MDSEPITQEPGSEKPKRGLPDEELTGTPVMAAAPPPQRHRRWPLFAIVGCLLAPCLCCLLAICLLAATGVGVAAVLSNSEVTQSATKTLTLSGDTNPTLTVNNPVGAVTIQRGSGDQVVVQYTKKAYGVTKSRATAELDNIQVDIQQPADDQVTIAVNTDRKRKTFFTFANHVDMTITVPEKVTLVITNNVGSIDVQNVDAAALDLKNNTGSITFDGSLSPETSTTYSMISNTGSIHVTLPQDVYVEIDATADVGSITVSSDFAKQSNVDDRHDAVGETWHGTLGTGSGTPPLLKLNTNTGSITVSSR